MLKMPDADSRQDDVVVLNQLRAESNLVKTHKVLSFLTLSVLAQVAFTA